MSHALVEVDGAFGEGGGQILRTSLALALITERPFHLCRIRAGRSKSGLQPQHLMSVRAAAEIGQASVRGAVKGSQDLVFEPGAVTAGEYTFAIGTAGATGLVLHTVFLPLALRGHSLSRLTITGGTHVKASPSFQFLDITWRAYLQRLGLKVSLELEHTGFYPRGGGVIIAEIEPCAELRGGPIAADPRAEIRVTGIAGVAGLPMNIAERMRDRAISRLKKQRFTADIGTETWPGGPGAGIALILEGPPAPTVFFGLGERGRPAERVADEAVDELLGHVAADATAVDPHSGDQLVLPLALAPGPSELRVSRVTQHLLTNVHVIRQFVPRDITCHVKEGNPGSVLIH
jgi:RNA 3'-terminal phosphate cyclase (ATP)